MSVKPLKIVVSKDRKGKCFFTVKSSNGKTLCHSESYSSKQACLDTIKMILLSLAFEPIITIEDCKDTWKTLSSCKSSKTPYNYTKEERR